MICVMILNCCHFCYINAAIFIVTLVWICLLVCDSYININSSSYLIGQFCYSSTYSGQKPELNSESVTIFCVRFFPLAKIPIWVFFSPQNGGAWHRHDNLYSNLVHLLEFSNVFWNRYFMTNNSMVYCSKTCVRLQSLGLLQQGGGSEKPAPWIDLSRKKTFFFFWLHQHTQVSNCFFTCEHEQNQDLRLHTRKLDLWLQFSRIKDRSLCVFVSFNPTQRLTKANESWLHLATKIQTHLTHTQRKQKAASLHHSDSAFVNKTNRVESMRKPVYPPAPCGHGFTVSRLPRCMFSDCLHNWILQVT